MGRMRGDMLRLLRHEDLFCGLKTVGEVFPSCSKFVALAVCVCYQPERPSTAYYPAK